MFQYFCIMVFGLCEINVLLLLLCKYVKEGAGKNVIKEAVQETGQLVY